MTVMTGRNDDVGMRVRHLLEFEMTVGELLVPEAGLVSASSAPAAVVVRPRRPRVDEIAFPRTGPDGKTEVFGRAPAEALADEVAGVLAGELQTFPVPGRIDPERSLTNPFRVEGDDAQKLEAVRYREFAQSVQDREELVSSLGIDVVPAAEVFDNLHLSAEDRLHVLVVAREHAPVRGVPGFRRIGPVRPDGMKNLPQRHHRFGVRRGFLGILVEVVFRSLPVHIDREAFPGRV